MQIHILYNRVGKRPEPNAGRAGLGPNFKNRDERLHKFACDPGRKFSIIAYAIKLKILLHFIAKFNS